MNVVDELAVVHEKLEQLEEGPAVVGDWHRFEARVGRMLVHAQNELTRLQRDLIELVRAEPPDRRWHELQVQTRALRDAMEELRMLRLCAQSRLFEYEAASAQTDFTNWTR